MNQFESLKIKAALKAQLKKKKLGYEDVAEHLGCSVPTVKRVLGPEELTLNRLLQILDLLDLSLGDLDVILQQKEETQEKLTPEQEDFLVKNRSHFSYLMKLYMGETPKQIAETFKLSQRSTDRYLIGLEKHGLIKVTGRTQRVKPALKNFPALGRGALGAAYYASLIQVAARYFHARISDSFQTKDLKGEGTLFSITTMRMTPETYKRLHSEIEKYIGEIAKSAAFEEKTYPETQLKTAVVLAGTSYVPHDYVHLKDLDEVFGPVTQL